MKFKILILLAAANLILSGCSERAPQPDDATSESETLTYFVDDFVSQYEYQEPTDLSAASFAAELRQTKTFLAGLREIDPATLTTDEHIDWQFAQSILRGKEIMQESVQAWKKDPRVYMQFRNLGRAVGRPGDANEKADDLIKLLALVPMQLANGQQNLAVYIPRFQELSLFTAEGAKSLFEVDIPAFAETVPDRRDELLAAGKAARNALESYIDFLKAELPEKPPGDWALGKETYDALLKDQYLLEFDSDSLYEFGVQQFDQTVRELEDLAKEIDPDKTWQELIVEIKNDYPAPENMIEAHQEWVDKAGEHFRTKELIAIPWKERVDVVPRAEYLRKDLITAIFPAHGEPMKTACLSRNG